MIGSIEANASSRGAGVAVAVVDTGVDYTHPVLNSRTVMGLNSWTVDPRRLLDPLDDFGHGTHVAGIVAGVAPDAAILAIKAMRGQCVNAPFTLGSLLANLATDVTVANGITFAVDAGARIINLSLGGAADTLFTRLAVKYAQWHDVVVIASAGNDGTSVKQYPAAYDSVLSVGSAFNIPTIGPALSFFSQWGDWVKIVAPGGDGTPLDSGDISSTTPTFDTYLTNPPPCGINLQKTQGYLAGTSMAAPFVSGVAALIASQHPEWTATRIVDQIRLMAIPADTAGLIPPPLGKTLGGGLLDAIATVGPITFDRRVMLEQFMPSPPYAPGIPTVIKVPGFTFTATPKVVGPLLAGLYVSDACGSSACNGTKVLGNANYGAGAIITMTRTDGGLFSLASFDGMEAIVNENSFPSFNATRIDVTATLGSGGTMHTSFVLDGAKDGAGGVMDSQTFTFPTNWKNLRSVKFEGFVPSCITIGCASFKIDNIVLK